MFLDQELKTSKNNEDTAPAKRIAWRREKVTRRLWKEPGAIEGLDLFYGPGGSEGAPDASATFTFVSRSTSGTSKKILVKDSSGKQWTVKFGSEARPETAASRIVWAMGYHVDEDYFVKQAHIEGWPDGDALNVRFERSHNGYKEVGVVELGKQLLQRNTRTRRAQGSDGPAE